MTGNPRTPRDTVVEQGRAVIQEARKPLLAVLGAGELAVSQIRGHLGELPGGTQERVRRLSARAGELRERARTLDRASVAGAVDGYVTHARSFYEQMARRGEQVVSRGRTDSQGGAAADPGAEGTSPARTIRVDVPDTGGARAPERPDGTAGSGGPVGDSR